MLTLFGLHRFVVYGIEPFQYLGTLQQHAQGDVATILLAVQTLLCYPHGSSASFCGWGRAAATLCLRCEDVSIIDIPVVVFVRLNPFLELSPCVIVSITRLASLNRAFDPSGRKALFSVMDISPCVNWFHALKTLDLDRMFHRSESISAHTRSPLGKFELY